MDCPCGETINLTYSPYQRPKEYPSWDNTLCFNCNYWEEIIANTNGSVVVNGTHYRLGLDRPGDKWKGFGGRKWVIHFFEPSEFITTTDLWYQGPIPSRFRSRLPDNAEFCDPNSTLPLRDEEEVEVEVSDRDSELRINKKEIGR